ncbi:PREDICTED: uncharacterized protein LOC104813285 [Tarenaya hassleriana]|uniref:uncharacterized protein LOC104813285 n=1 Tax=Tarenaya hassleriana TaxID=28532 RepID=UPI00053C0C30|nr:PREDICTED: uncharacterized protein LOC104813285 [Tarenaya hassleriana]
MGSLGDDEFEQLVIDYIESPVVDHRKKSPTPLSPLLSLKEVLGNVHEDEREIMQKIAAYSKRKKLPYEGDDEKREMMKKLVAKLKSDGYDASLCRTSWDSSFDRREGCQVFKFKGKYEYIDVITTTSANGETKPRKRIIVDLDFKSQFEVAKPAKAYKDITQILPVVFVATEERLKKVVSLVCSALKRSMKEEGMHLPPWRKPDYMRSKWLSENRKT